MPIARACLKHMRPFSAQAKAAALELVSIMSIIIILGIRVTLEISVIEKKGKFSKNLAYLGEFE